MDPVTHGLTGALLAEAGIRQKLGNSARVAMAVSAMFPDIDIVYRIGGLPEYLANHRALTHSFVGIIASGIILGPLGAYVAGSRGPASRAEAGPQRYLAWISACWIALFSHQILDLITSYGTIVFYPFSRERYFFDWVFIVDVFLSAILAFFLIRALRNPESSIRIARKGLIAASIYIAFCSANHQMALYQLRHSAQANGIAYRSLGAVPQALLPFRWSGIIDAGSQYYQKNYVDLQPPQPPFAVYPKSTGSYWEDRAKQTDLGVLFFWFARYPVAHQEDRGNLHIIDFYDLRFLMSATGFRLRTPFILEIKMDDAGNVIESSFSRS